MKTGQQNESKKANETAASSNPLSEQKTRVDAFLTSIPDGVIAAAAFNCRDFARALLHVEQHIRIQQDMIAKDKKRTEPVKDASKNRLQTLDDREKASVALTEQLPFLQRIYQQLAEPDGMAGVAALRTVTSLDESLLDHRAGGRWAQVLTCYEVARQTREDLDLHLGLLQCQLELGHFETTMMHATGAIQRYGAWAGDLNHYRIHAAWKLGKWAELGDFLAFDTERLRSKPLRASVGETGGTLTSISIAGCSSAPAPFEVYLGRLLHNALQSDKTEFLGTLTTARQTIAREIALVSPGPQSYYKIYPLTMRLQMLQELQGKIPHCYVTI